MLIKSQLKETGSAKIIMTLWVTWKKPIGPLVELDPEDLEDAQGTEGNAVDKGRSASPVNPNPQEMDECEKEEIKKGRPVVKNKLNGWHDWLVELKMLSAKYF